MNSFETLYGKHFVSHNVHNLLHLCNDVRMYGSLNSFSAFRFENYLAFVKRQLRKSEKPLQQLWDRYKKIELNMEYVTHNEVEICLSKKHADRPVIYRSSMIAQYKVFNAHLLNIRCDTANDYFCILKTDKCVYTENIVKTVDGNIYMTESMAKYTVHEFHEGLNVIPSIWLEDTDKGLVCMWPEHLKNLDMPRKGIEWPTVPVVRKFSYCDSYDAAVIKCYRAEETPIPDDTEVDDDANESSDLQEKKQMRRLKAKRKQSTDEGEANVEKETISHGEAKKLEALTKYPIFPSESFTSRTVCIQDDVETHTRAVTSVAPIIPQGKSTAIQVNLSHGTSMSGTCSRPEIEDTKKWMKLRNISLQIFQRRETNFSLLNQKLDDLAERMTALEGRSGNVQDPNFYVSVEKALPLANEKAVGNFERELQDEAIFSSTICIHV